MRVFMLGGYGAVGVPAAEILAGSDLVSEIALAGRSKERARQACAAIGDKARAVQVDGADEERLATLLDGYNIILNAVGNDVALPALRAAIRAGADYADVGWSTDFIARMQAHSTEARDAGITAILCNGISPCLTNLMGVHAARQLDETEQIQGGRAWVFEGARSFVAGQWHKRPVDNLAALNGYKGFLEWVLQLARDAGGRAARAYQDGRWVDVDPVSVGVPAPVSADETVTAFPYVSMDPVFDELPPDLGQAPPVSMFLTPFPPSLHGLFRKQAARVTAGESDPASALQAFFAIIEAEPEKWLATPDNYVPLTPDWVTAVGQKEGRAARFSCWLAPANWSEGSGWLLTSVPLAVTALRILRGDVRERGVIPAEKAFEPWPYFDEVAALYRELPPGQSLIGESFEWLA